MLDERARLPAPFHDSLESYLEDWREDMIKNFRDILALLLAVVVFPAIWVLQGMGMITLSGEIIGASIAIETLIGQFYFRKSNTETTG